MKRGFLALLGATLVAATKPSRGWRASVDTTDVGFATDQTGDGQFGLFVVAPIVLTRLFSRESSVVVTGTVQPVGNTTDEDIEYEPQVAFTETISIPGDTATQDASFDFTIPTPWMDHLLSLSVSVPGTQDTTETDGLVITLDSNGDYVAKTPGEWDHDENIRIIAELEAETVRIIPQDPSDLGEDPEISDEDEYPVNGVPKEGDDSGGDPGDGSGGDPGDGSGGDPGDGKTTKIIVTKTTTVCPTPTPKPPCDDDRLHPRQIVLSPATVNAKVTFTGWNKNVQDLRLVQVTAWGNVYNSAGGFVERVNAFETLDVRGNAQFRFDLRAGQRIVVNRLVARLEGVKYMVGTRKTESDPLVRKTVTMTLNVNPWNVNAGETKSYTNKYPRNVHFDGLLVADTFQRIIDFTRFNIVGSAAINKVNVWFPSTDPGTFFSSAPVYINIPHDDARDPDVLAHEYGHYLDFLARDGADFQAGGNHTSCGSPNDQTALSEGYATAFGLLALDKTLLSNTVYGQYTDKRPDGTLQVNRQFETYACNSRTLQNDEGRITAAIFDLGDRKLDASQAASDDSGQIWDTFQVSDINIKFKPRLLFWSALRDNPQTMTEYWGAIRALMTVNAEQKAWNVLRYNWAEIPRSPAAP
ncbi:uncharacterized protein J7T54_005844 [Emericellopsis cladophorae]|uniref:Peptidase M43 pregnancy-associated plasma-A domain-containing protein n=1 Tax=Emericellopsis cladophorae TaxID=2686198 RepID=A0A9P9XVE7_9HYPO|nr:uncharacterized protein J7T54_005844 [Emericellopsis cladophorae]KAI6778328.1 hypothetical protein J7T54_005844 [Emericellopsis cladophorae]